MSRVTASWLSGTSGTQAQAEPNDRPGVRLGLPAEGVNSIAPVGRRIVAFGLDAVGSGLIASLLTRPDIYDDASLSQQRLASLVVFAVVYVFFSAFVGQTPGMYVMGLRVCRLEDGRALGVWRAVVRTGLLVLLVPALVWDRDQRGMHDKAVNSVIVRAR